MAVFKFVVSDPKSRKSFQTEADQSKAAGIVGKKIGEEFSGDLIGLNGYAFQITGGTDKDGFPMYPGLKGSVRKKLLLSGAPGLHPRMKGQRRRKMVCGNTISDSIVQINAKVIKYGDKPFETLIPKKEKTPKKAVEKAVEKKEIAEKKPEEKKEEKAEEKQKEKPKEASKPEKKEEK